MQPTDANALAAAGPAAIGGVASLAGEYELAWTRANGDSSGEPDWRAGGSLRVAGLSAEVSDLENDVEYLFHVRTRQGDTWSPWSPIAVTTSTANGDALGFGDAKIPDQTWRVDEDVNLVLPAATAH